MHENIGQVIRQLRTDARLSQQELAGDLYTKAYVSQVEKGKVKPSKKALQHFAEVLGKPFLASMGAEETHEFQRIVALVDYARSLSRSGQFSDSLAQFREAMILSEEFRYPALKVKALIGLSQAYLEDRRFEQALEIGKEANRLARQLGEPGEIAATLLQLASIFTAKGEEQDAVVAYEDGVRLIEHTQDPQQQATLIALLAGLGRLLGKMGFIDRAIGIFQQSASLAHHLDNLEYQAQSHMGIGLAHYRAGNYYEAMNHTRRAMTIYEMLDNTQVKVDLLTYMAEAEAKLGHHREALQYYQDSLVIQIGERSVSHLDTLCRMAGLKLKLSDAQGAWAILEEAYALPLGSISVGQRARLALLKGQVKAAQSRWQEAQTAFSEAVQLLQDGGSVKHQALALAELAKAYQELGQIEESVKRYAHSVELLKQSEVI